MRRSLMLVTDYSINSLDENPFCFNKKAEIYDILV
jgi:hypothetical protein